MEYKKIINLLRNVSNQPSKCRTKKMIQINDQSEGHLIPILTLDLKMQRKRLIYMITAMYTYLLREE